jgi:hypothetical protein
MTLQVGKALESIAAVAMLCERRKMGIFEGLGAQSTFFSLWGFVMLSDALGDLGSTIVEFQVT